MIEYDNLGRSNAPYANDICKVFEKVLHKGWFVLGEEVEKKAQILVMVEEEVVAEVL